MERRSPVVEIHIRISRRFVFWACAFLLVAIVVPFLLLTLGGSSGGVQVGPVRRENSLGGQTSGGLQVGPITKQTSHP